MATLNPLRLAEYALLVITLLARAGSFNSILHVLWLRLGGAKKTSPVVDRFITGQLAAEKLRYTTRVPVKNIKQAARLIEWIDLHDLDSGQVSRMSPWIDLREPGLVVLPPLKFQSRRLALALLGILMFLTCLAATNLDSTTVQFKDSKEFVLINSEGATAFNGKWAVNATDCGSNPHMEHGLDICSFWTSDAGQKAWRRERTGQARVFFAISLAALLWSIRCVLAASGSGLATSVWRKQAIGTQSSQSHQGISHT